MIEAETFFQIGAVSMTGLPLAAEICSFKFAVTATDVRRCPYLLLAVIKNESKLLVIVFR
jgi:hypothetical protein